MAKVKSINVLSMAKLHTVAFGGLGAMAGVLYSFGGLLIDALVSLGWITSSETPGLSYGTVLAFGALIGMPAIGMACGFIAGIAVACLYNIVARLVGGIEMNLE